MDLLLAPLWLEEEDSASLRSVVLSQNWIQGLCNYLRLRTTFELYDVNKSTSLSFSFPNYKIGILVPT